MIANYGGTDIYSPLDHFYSKPKNNQVDETHMMLLTDGAVWDTNRVV